MSQASYNDKRNVVNRASLMEPIIRHRIQDSIFYKQHLYLTNELTLLPVVVEHVKFVGGTDSVGRPCPFICCLLRMLELEPLKEVVLVYLNQIGYDEFKYLTALVLIYVRMVYPPDEAYIVLEESLKDYRKLRFQLKTPEFNQQGLPIHYRISYMDVWSEQLLQEERVVDIVLPRMPQRRTLEEKVMLEPIQFGLESEEEDSYESDSD